MSTRERWVIYPLLFLALGAALRSKFTSSFEVGFLTSRKTEAKQIVCEDLVITGADGKKRVRLGNTGVQSGAIEMYGNDGKLLATLNVDPTKNRAIFQLQTPDGTPQTVLYCEEHGGALDIHGTGGQLQATLRSTEVGGVVTAVDPAGKMIELGHRSGQPGAVVIEPESPPADKPTE